MGRSSRRILDLNARESIWIRFEIHRDSIWDCDEFEIAMQGETEYQNESLLLMFRIDHSAQWVVLSCTQNMHTADKLISWCSDSHDAAVTDRFNWY